MIRERFIVAMRLVRFLSLDVVLGGVVFAKAVAHAFNVPIPPTVLASLACAIWLIYTLDHLMDALRNKQLPNIPRHAFHWHNKYPLVIAFLIVLFIGLWLLFYLPYQTLIYGCLLSAFVAIYFFALWYFSLFFTKEVLVAALYASGIFLGTYSSIEVTHWFIYMFFVQTMLVATLNLLLFSKYELAHDLEDGHLSWVTHYGKERSEKHLNFLFLMEFVLAAVGFYLFRDNEKFVILQLALFLMTFVLWLIHYFPNWFTINERYRWVGDLVFLFAAVIFLF